MTTDLFESVYYRHKEEELPIPDWAKFLAELGNTVAQHTQKDTPMTLVVALPSRAYGAAFIATGMVGHSIETTDEVDVDVHFNMLRNLPNRTPVVIYEKNKKTKGILDHSDSKSDDVILIQTRKDNPQKRLGGCWRRFEKKDTLKIRIANHSEKLSVSSHRIISKNTNKEWFAGAIFRREFSSTHLLATRIPACVIIGTQKIFRQEIEKAKITVRISAKVQPEGSVQDILRVGDFLSPGQYYYTSFLPGSRESRRKSKIPETQFGVIFDGASAFIHRGHEAKTSNRIIILDKSDQRSTDAVQNIEQDARSIEPCSSISGTLSKMEIPVGCEVFTYMKKYGDEK